MRLLSSPPSTPERLGYGVTAPLMHMAAGHDAGLGCIPEHEMVHSNPLAPSGEQSILSGVHLCMPHDKQSVTSTPLPQGMGKVSQSILLRVRSTRFPFTRLKWATKSQWVE
jgi:hypothetical protein